MPDRCNKETVDRPTPDMKAFQGAFQKGAIVDVAFGLCATEDEMKANVLRWFNFLNRHGQAYQHIAGKVKPDTWLVELTHYATLTQEAGKVDNHDSSLRRQKRHTSRFAPELESELTSDKK